MHIARIFNGVIMGAICSDAEDKFMHIRLAEDNSSGFSEFCHDMSILFRFLLGKNT